MHPSYIFRGSSTIHYFTYKLILIRFSSFDNWNEGITMEFTFREP